MTQPISYLGVTPPVSLAYPTAHDQANTQVLSAFLDRVAPQASDADRDLRLELIASLRRLVQVWVIEVAQLAGLEDIGSDQALLIPFGSYALGLVEASSDLDAVVVTPNFVCKEDFFSSLVLKISELDFIKDLTVVKEASTPVIKFVMRGVDVDLLFCSLPNEYLMSEAINNILNEDSLLIALTDPSARALNGPRVAKDILQLTPTSSKAQFLLVLRFVKHWAKSRAIYSNAMGYFGGVTWAILVARVCQLFPNMSASQQVARFFKVFALWDWTHPVQLTSVTKKFEAPHLRVWSPNNLRPDLMPIITPSFPAMNSAYNVSLTTKAVIQAELLRAHALFQEKTPFDEAFLDRLSEKITSDQFPTLVEIKVSADRSAVHQKLAGFVESRIRGLLGNAEKTAAGLKLRPLHALKEVEGLVNTSAMNIGVSTQGTSGESTDLRAAVAAWLEKLAEWSEAAANRGAFDVTVRVVAGGAGDKRRKIASDTS